MRHWVFIHGAGGSSAFWELTRLAFPDALFLDLPGHEAGPAGSAALRPPRGPVEATIEGYADWVTAKLLTPGWDDVVLVGHSMGGAIAQVIGMRRPAWLRALVLSSAAAQLRAPPGLIELLEIDYPAAVDLFIETAFAVPPGRYRREGVRRQMLRVPQPVALADFRACEAFDSRAALEAGALGLPAVAVCGEEDAITPPAESRALAERIPGAAFRTIPGAGHMAPIEQPEAWLREVLSFEF